MNLRRTTADLRSNGATSRWGAFTLIELLVVIAIIALLMTLLLPSISNIRETARTMQCATDMRRMGVAAINFTSDNQGRMPGSGEYRLSNTSNSGWSWRGLISPYVKQTIQTHADVTRVRVGESLHRRGELFCPSMRKFDNSGWPRAHLFSTAAAGGPSWNPNPWYGTYGLPVKPSPNLWPWTEFGDRVIRYHLGSPYSMSRSPTAQILIMETFAATDYMSQSNDARPWVPLNPDDGIHPPWTGDVGRRMYAFRHNLTANTLFFDGHVERLTPDDELRSSRRVLFFR